MLLKQSNNAFVLSAVIKGAGSDLDPTPLLQQITDFQGLQTNLNATYDEQISIQENSSDSFSFKVMQKTNGKINPFISLLNIGRELQLFWRDKYYYFVITSRNPNFLKDNVEFSFNCQDSFSYFLSHNQVGQSYGDDKDNLDYTGRNIADLMKIVLNKSHLQSKWQLDPVLESGSRGIADFPNTMFGLVDAHTSITATLNLTNSNTYNAIIEIAKIFNARIEIEYNKNPYGPHIIHMLNRTYPRKTYFRLDPNVNLSKINLSEDGQNFCTVMYVQGGEDAYGNHISLLPPMTENIKKIYGWKLTKALESQTEVEDKYTIDDVLGSSKDLKDYNDEHVDKKIILNTEDLLYCNCINNRVKTASSMLYDFNYFLNTGIITPAEYNNLITKLNKDYRDANINLQIASEKYYNLMYNNSSLTEQEEDLIRLMAANYEQIIMTELDKKPEEQIFYNMETETIETQKNTIELSSENKKDNILRNVDDIITKLYKLWSTNYLETRLSVDNNFIENTRQKQDKLLKEKQREYIKKYQEICTLITVPEVPSYDYNDGYLIYRELTDAEKTRITNLKKDDIFTYERYATLKTELEEISKFLDKKNTDSNTKVQGICSLYITAMNWLETSFNKENPNKYEILIKQQYQVYKSSSTINYIEIFLKTSSEKEKVWNKIIERYGRYIIEGNFSDSEQLDNNALYSKALSQFVEYSFPQTKYSAEIIDWDILAEDYIKPVELGDEITINYEDINFFDAFSQKEKKIVVRLETDKKIYMVKTINNLPLASFKKDLSITYLRDYIFQDKYYIDLLFTFAADQTPVSNYKFIQKINNSKVLNYNILYDNKNISLSITGLSKNLRESTTSLSVSNEASMSRVIQKMLLSVRV